LRRNFFAKQGFLEHLQRFLKPLTHLAFFRLPSFFRADEYLILGIFDTRDKFIILEYVYHHDLSRSG